MAQPLDYKTSTANMSTQLFSIRVDEHGVVRMPEIHDMKPTFISCPDGPNGQELTVGGLLPDEHRILVRMTGVISFTSGGFIQDNVLYEMRVLSGALVTLPALARCFELGTSPKWQSSELAAQLLQRAQQQRLLIVEVCPAHGLWLFAVCTRLDCEVAERGSVWTALARY